jgi:hypothetical protein
MEERHERDHEQKQESPHVRAEMREANIGAFEDGTPNKFVGGPDTGPVELDPDAVQGPGGDSRPDNIDPATAEFTSLDDSPMMTTTREPSDQPKDDPSLSEEYAEKRSDDNIGIAGQPLGPNDEEVAVLKPGQYQHPKKMESL